jgi:hypothetical protein
MHEARGEGPQLAGDRPAECMHVAEPAEAKSLRDLSEATRMRTCLGLTAASARTLPATGRGAMVRLPEAVA